MLATDKNPKKNHLEPNESSKALFLRGSRPFAPFGPRVVSMPWTPKGECKKLVKTSAVVVRTASSLPNKNVRNFVSLHIYLQSKTKKKDSF